MTRTRRWRWINTILAWWRGRAIGITSIRRLGRAPSARACASQIRAQYVSANFRSNVTGATYPRSRTPPSPSRVGQEVVLEEVRLVEGQTVRRENCRPERAVRFRRPDRVEEVLNRRCGFLRHRCPLTNPARAHEAPRPEGPVRVPGDLLPAVVPAGSGELMPLGSESDGATGRLAPDPGRLPLAAVELALLHVAVSVEYEAEQIDSPGCPANRLRKRHDTGLDERPPDIVYRLCVKFPGLLDGSAAHARSARGAGRTSCRGRGGTVRCLRRASASSARHRHASGQGF